MRIWLHRRQPIAQLRIVLFPGTMHESAEVVDVRVGDALTLRGKNLDEIRQACALTRSVINRAKESSR